MKVDAIVFYVLVCTHVFEEVRCRSGFLILPTFYFEYLDVTFYLEIDDLG